MGSKPPQEVDVAVPTDLESGRSKLVYLYVAVCDGATMQQLCEDLDLRTGTALSITGTLRDGGYLERTDEGFEVA